jgi:hypothetical protein
MFPGVHDYSFKDVFTGDFGETGFTDKAGGLKVFHEPFMKEAVALEEAKRKAAIVTSQLADPNDADRDKAVESEKRVVKCRLDLIKRLLVPADLTEDLGICNRVKDTSKERVSVQYRLLEQRSGGLIPVQTQVAWPAQLTWKSMHTLAASRSNEDALPAKLNNLLNLMLSRCLLAASKDESTRKMRDLYRMRGLYRRMRFIQEKVEGSTVSAMWHQAEPRHKTMLEFLGSPDQTEEDNKQPVQVSVLFGVLDINHCEQWQNPLINMYAKLAVQGAGVRAIEDMHTFHTADSAVRDTINPRACMHNFLRPVILIRHSTDVHVLTLAPYMGADTCTVQHVVIEDDDRGILDLKDMALQNVRPPGETKCTELEYFHCVGSRPHTRFNETELNHLHVMGLTSDLYDDDAKSEAEPDPAGDADGAQDPAASDTAARLGRRPRLSAGRRKPSDGDDDDEFYTVFPASDSGEAKSARISFVDWDVLITTCAWTDESPPTTCITMINYPPQGMRYAKETLHGGASEFRPKKPIFDKDLDPSRAFYIKWFARTMDNHVPVITEWNINLIDTSEELSLTLKMKAYMKAVHDQIQSILSNSDDHGTSIWIDNKEIKHHAFTYNIKFNMHAVRRGTVLDIYRDAWRHFFVGAIAEARQQEGHFILPGNCYFWASEPTKSVKTTRANMFNNVWEDIMEHDIDMAHDWQSYSDARYQRESEAGKFQEYTLSHQLGPASAPTLGGRFQQRIKGPMYVGSADRLPIAPRQPPTELLERIKRLEAAKLEDARRAQNREHLLSQVLARLAPASHA